MGEGRGPPRSHVGRPTERAPWGLAEAARDGRAPQPLTQLGEYDNAVSSSVPLGQCERFWG
ncbi:unnamed protein product [Laminaria digitata]